MEIDDKDKLILVAYINTVGISNAKAAALTSEIYYKLLHKFDNTVKVLVFPVHDGQTRVEVVNPKYVIYGQEIIPEDIQEKINTTEELSML